MRYKVPQDVQREDRILWFMTLKQLIIILVGGGISYLMFVTLTKSYHLGTMEIALIWLPGIIALAFAFLKIKGLPLFQFLLLMVETLIFRAPRRHWQSNVTPFVSMTQVTSDDKKKSTAPVIEKDASEDKIKNLAALIDGEVPTPQQP